MNPFHLQWEQQDLDIFFTFYRKEQDFKLKVCTGAIEKQRWYVKHLLQSFHRNGKIAPVRAPQLLKVRYLLIYIYFFNFKLLLLAVAE